MKRIAALTFALALAGASVQTHGEHVTRRSLRSRLMFATIMLVGQPRERGA